MAGKEKNPMQGDRCLVHGNELHYDMRSGFEICYECEREKVQPAKAEKDWVNSPDDWAGGFADNH
jgi:hypothetical protein